MILSCFSEVAQRTNTENVHFWKPISRCNIDNRALNSNTRTPFCTRTHTFWGPISVYENLDKGVFPQNRSFRKIIESGEQSHDTKATRILLMHCAHWDRSPKNILWTMFLNRRNTRKFSTEYLIWQFFLN